ncbi:MAG: hypothetical protein WBM48_11045 [Polyangiales bacterium]
MNNSSSASTQNPALRSSRSAIATSKAFFFAAAGISFALSVWLWFSGDRERGLFVGIWVPSILSAGALLLAGGNDE